MFRKTFLALINVKQLTFSTIQNKNGNFAESFRLKVFFFGQPLQ